MKTKRGYTGRNWLAGVAMSIAAVALGIPTISVATGGAFEDGHTLDVPSGQEVTFLDVIEGEEGPVGSAIRFRFIAPRIARDNGDVEFMQAEGDMAVLCQDYVLPHMIETGVDLPAQIIIVLSDRIVEYGLADPDATQFFEAYRPEDGMCIWEGF